MLAVKTSLDVFIVWIYVVKNCISVNLVGGSKYNHLEVFVSFLKTLHYVWPDVYTSIHSLFVWKVDLEYDVRVLGLNVVNTMNQCLIHVKDDELLLGLRYPWRR